MSDPYRLSGGVTIKFRPSGGHLDGIALTEATNRVRLSRSHPYAVRSIVDMCNHLTLKVQWTGYRSFVYEIPVRREFDGTLLQSLVRRVAIAIVHFMDKNAIDLHLDRVVLHRREEVQRLQPALWIPVLSTHQS